MSAVDDARSSSPYKGLAPFEDSELDALLFFGRERETRGDRREPARVEADGALRPERRRQELDPPRRPSPGACARSAPDADVAVLDDWAAIPTLPEPNGETFLILDQFEEYFLYHDEGPLHDELPALLHAAARARAARAARGRARAARRIPGAHPERLREPPAARPARRAAARAAIVGPLDRWNAVAPRRAHGDRARARRRRGRARCSRSRGASRRRTSSSCSSASGRQEQRERLVASARGDAAPPRRRGGDRQRASRARARRAAAARGRDRDERAPVPRHAVAHEDRALVRRSRRLHERVARRAAAGAGACSRRSGSCARCRRRRTGGSRYEIFHDVLAEPVLAWRREFDARNGSGGVRPAPSPARGWWRAARCCSRSRWSR